MAKLSDMKIKIKCDTEIKGKKIIQKIYIPDSSLFNGYEVASRVMDTSEKEIKEALIRLGWTPPKDELIEMATNKPF